MNNLLLFSFVSLFICQNAQASDLDGIGGHQNPTNKSTINPCCNLFEQEERFSLLEEDGVSLKVSFSEPIYEDVKVIDFDNSSNSDRTQNFVKWLMKNSTFFDIICDGKSVGKVKTDITPNALQQVYIRNIEVNEEYRGRGIGTKAIELVVQFYLQKRFGIESFFAQIKKGNAASIRVFEKNDFSTDGSPCLGLLAYGRKVKD